MIFKARQLKGGQVEIVGLEKFLKSALARLTRNQRLSPPGKRVGKKSRLVSVRKMKIKGPTAPSALDALVSALEANKRRGELLRAGKQQKDQLLRSLIPLYLARKGDGITSGVTSNFWQLHGVRFAAPNAAKVLREQKGYSKAKKGGPQITPRGIQYVEAALKR